MIVSLFSSGGGGTYDVKLGVALPTVDDTGLVYDGTSKKPTIGSYSTELMTVTYTAQTNAGTYQVHCSLNDPDHYAWLNTIQSTDQDIPWTIARATGTITPSAVAVEVGEDETQTVSVVASENTTFSAVSANTNIATVSVSGGTISITDGGTEGETTVTVSAADSANYTYGSITIAVVVQHLTIVSWSSGTDAQIVKMVEAADAGKINLSDYWNVGDKRTVSLSAMAATGVGESHRAQNVVLLLADKNNSNYEYVTATSGRTYCNFVVHQESCLASTDSGTAADSEKGYMNSSRTNAGGWNACARRTWCNNVYYNAIPSTLKSIFKQVKVKAMNGGNQSGTTLVTSNDYCFLPAAKEVFYGTVPNDTYAYSNSTEWNALSTWKYYETTANRVKKMGLSGAACEWWERSSYRDNTISFCYVVYNGNDNTYFANIALGLAPSGCI